MVTSKEDRMPDATNMQADVIVVGSGPGGATVARELSRKGKQVLLLERGRDHRPRGYYGTYLGAILYSDRGSLLFTQEGLNIVRPLMVGGATSMYCGCAAPPPDWMKNKKGDIKRRFFSTDSRRISIYTKNRNTNYFRLNVIRFIFL